MERAELRGGGSERACRRHPERPEEAGLKGAVPRERATYQKEWGRIQKWCRGRGEGEALV